MKRFHKTLKFRLLVSFAAILGVALLSTAVLSGIRMVNALGDYEVDTERAKLASFAVVMAEAYEAGDQRKLQETVQIATNYTIGEPVIALLPDGNYVTPYFLFDKRNDSVLRRAYDVLPEIGEKFNVTGNGDDNPHAYVKIDISELVFGSAAELPPNIEQNIEQKVIPKSAYLVDVSAAIQNETDIYGPVVDDLRTSFIQSLLIAGFITVFVGMGATLYITNDSLKPLTYLSYLTKKLGSGDLSQRIKVGGGEEIRRLAGDFNRMASNLEKAEQNRKRITSDVAHELRTPLSNLKGYIEAIEDGVLEPDKKTIKKLSSQTSHLEHLINDLYLIATANAGNLPINKTEGDLVATVKRVIDDFLQRADEREITIGYEAPRELICMLDQQRIRQVVSNLLDNAIRHTPKGGSVDVSVNSDAKGNHKVVIRDTGEGISKEHLDRIFEEYYRADPSRTIASGGTGLGLTIVKKLVEAHGGSVEVDSKVGYGTTFVVTITP